MSNSLTTCDERDPFSILYDAIWSLVDAFKPFSDFVRVGNRIRLDDRSRNPIKETIKAGDLPEVILWPFTGDANLHGTSSTTAITRRYRSSSPISRTLSIPSSAPPRARAGSPRACRAACRAAS